MIYAEDVLPSASGQELAARMWFIQVETRKKYRKPKQDMVAIRTYPTPPLSRSEVI